MHIACALRQAVLEGLGVRRCQCPQHLTVLLSHSAICWPSALSKWVMTHQSALALTCVCSNADSCFQAHPGAPHLQVYLNLVLEFVPETVFRISKHYSKSGQRMPTLFVKLYVFQMCRALAHIHAMGVCHRDIKPQNLLVNTHTHQLKLCDFGSAKVGSMHKQSAMMYK